MQSDLLQIKGEYYIQRGQVQNLAEISIEDNGSGIASVDLPHIFEKFYRIKINPSVGQSSGSGTSLSLVKSIIEKHGGEVGAVSELGKGSTFFIRIPIE